MTGGQEHGTSALFLLNTRLRLRQLGIELGRPATLDDIGDRELDWFAEHGFQWIWCLGVWQTGEAGRQFSLTDPNLGPALLRHFPELRESDITGSCFAVTGYDVHPVLGGNPALQRLRRRMRERGLRLMLDFVPNHTAPDHPWVTSRPEMYVQGTEADLTREPTTYARVATDRGPLIIAHGRDPYFPAWPDTFQLNYGNAGTWQAMQDRLLNIAGLCDGVRCDMAMLILPEVFERTWGIAAQPFWADAIEAVHEQHPDFVFMAEAYWDLEWTLMQEGFDYAYDKRLYDRLVALAARPARDHLRAGLDFQRKLVRFLENHDEPRAAATLRWDAHQAAAVVTHFCPGLHLFHQGQFEGQVTHVSVHLSWAPADATNPAVQVFYERLLTVMRLPPVGRGRWQLLEPREAWARNHTWDGFIGFVWDAGDAGLVIVCVNYQDTQGQCYVSLPCPDLVGRAVMLVDHLGPARYERHGDELVHRGLFLDMPAWGYHVFTAEWVGV